MAILCRRSLLLTIFLQFLKFLISSFTFLQSFLLSPPHCLLVFRSLLCFWRILHDESGELVPHINIRHKTTSSTFQLDHLVFGDDYLSLRVSTSITLDIFLDKVLKKASKFGSVMRAIHMGSPCFLIKFGLRTKLTTEVLCGVRSWPCQSLCNINHVDNVCLDSISSALNFGNHLGHLVPVEGIIAVCSTNILQRHLDHS
ncbi:hypothetical protein OIU84_014657 [Salix udensis]|uniref:Uncharacterized protein n=1 Tax=Salix udensis TaxID=889485 RepID=A0AAD6NS79_9ROSI|nr:hypothetical protein OIU84_014657 [Salix udensis]